MFALGCHISAAEFFESGMVVVEYKVGLMFCMGILCCSAGFVGCRTEGRVRLLVGRVYLILGQVTCVGG